VRLTTACYVGRALEGRGIEAEYTHHACRHKGGVIYERPEMGSKPVILGLCECLCHDPDRLEAQRVKGSSNATLSHRVD
jgi:hypothetical protein